jgi:hypothetical protein
MSNKSLFERFPKTTLLCLIAIFALSALVILEKLASSFGLGKPIIYQSHPIYGYRPLPNQRVARNKNCSVKINNLGLRAEDDWDPKEIKNKILFLGDSVTYGGSYIANQDLFSHIATREYPGFQAGNGGVNAWGVNNVAALVKECEFDPAQIIVSTFPEGDFYRGLMRIGGQPFWTITPRFALEELAHHFIYQFHNKKTPGLHDATLSFDERKLILENGVQHLKEMDNFLKAQGRNHLIYITPSQKQLLGSEKEDEILKALFSEYGLSVIYIKDKLPPLSQEECLTLFHDNIHLSQKGHALWGKVIANDLKPLTNKETL